MIEILKSPAMLEDRKNEQQESHFGSILFQMKSNNAGLYGAVKTLLLISYDLLFSRTVIRIDYSLQSYHFTEAPRTHNLG